MAEQQNKYAVQITRKGLFVWCGLIFFTMGWMFILGILVGRGTAPVPLSTHALEKELKSLKAAVAQDEKAEIETQSKQSEDKKPELGFYEELKKAPPRANYKISPEPAEKRPFVPPKRPAPAKESAPSAVAPVKAEPKPAPPAAEPVMPSPQKLPAEAPSFDKGRFTIQVGAFKDVESADRLVKILRDKGYPAYHLGMQVPGKGVWFRVRVGAFESRAAAEPMLKRLKNEQMKGLVIGTQ